MDWNERFDAEIGWAAIYPPSDAELDAALGDAEIPQIVWDAYNRVGITLDAIAPGHALWDGGPVRDRWSVILSDDAYTDLSEEVLRQLGKEAWETLSEELADSAWDLARAVARACDSELACLSK